MYENLIKSLDVLVIGMTAVIIALSFFSVIIWTLKKSDSTITSLYKKVKYRNRQISAEDNIDDTEIVAVITAAAMSVLDRKSVV